MEINMRKNRKYNRKKKNQTLNLQEKAIKSINL